MSFPRHLKRLVRWPAAIVFAAFAAIPVLVAAQRITFDLRNQAEDAEIIVVGGVISVRETGRTEVEISGHTLPAKIFDAEVRIDRTLKGSNVLPQAVVRFTLPVSPSDSMGYSGIDAGSYRILFLRRGDDHFEFANPSSSSLPAAPQAPQSHPNDVLTSVIYELATAIDSPQTEEVVKLGVIYRLGSTSSEVVTEILRQQLTTSNATIRASVAAATGAAQLRARFGGCTRPPDDPLGYGSQVSTRKPVICYWTIY